MKSSDLMTGCLYACSEGKGRNCGICRNCLKTLWAADAYGCLDGFGEAFDVRSYRDERPARIMKLLESDETNLLADIKASLADSDDSGYREACSASSRIGVAENIRMPISERKATLEGYSAISDTAARLLARYMMASSDPDERSEGREILEGSIEPKDSRGRSSVAKTRTIKEK